MKRAYMVMMEIEVDNKHVEHNAEKLGRLALEAFAAYRSGEPVLEQGTQVTMVAVSPSGSEDGTWTQESSRGWASDKQALPKIPGMITGLVWGPEKGIG